MNLVPVDLVKNISNVMESLVKGLSQNNDFSKVNYLVWL